MTNEGACEREPRDQRSELQGRALAGLGWGGGHPIIWTRPRLWSSDLKENRNVNLSAVFPGLSSKPRSANVCSTAAARRKDPPAPTSETQVCGPEWRPTVRKQGPFEKSAAVPSGSGTAEALVWQHAASDFCSAGSTEITLSASSWRQMWRIHEREETKRGLILLPHNKTAVAPQLPFMRAPHFCCRVV